MILRISERTWMQKKGIFKAVSTLYRMLTLLWITSNNYWRNSYDMQKGKISRAKTLKEIQNPSSQIYKLLEILEDK